MGTCWHLWEPMGAYGGLWGLIGIYGDLWGPIGTSGDLWAPMGTYRPLWGPMGAYVDLWGPIGTYGDLSGPMGTYGVGASTFCTPILTPNPPPSSKHQIYIRHITHLVVYTAKTTCHIRHQTSDFIHNPARALSGLFSWA